MSESCGAVGWLFGSGFRGGVYEYGFRPERNITLTPTRIRSSVLCRMICFVITQLTTMMWLQAVFVPTRSVRWRRSAVPWNNPRGMRTLPFTNPVLMSMLQSKLECWLLGHLTAYVPTLTALHTTAPAASWSLHVVVPHLANRYRMLLQSSDSSCRHLAKPTAVQTHIVQLVWLENRHPLVVCSSMCELQ